MEAGRESTTPSTEQVNRTADGFTSLTTNVMKAPFKAALIAFLVICQLPFNLVVNSLFIDFLLVLCPFIENLIPSTGTVRKWIIKAFEDRREVLKASLSRAKSKIHFSFDL